MKSLYGIMVAIFFVVSVSACGNTMAELRANGDAIVDNTTNAASQTLSTVGVIVKKVLSMGFAVYDLGKKMVDDTTDNVGTVVNLATGASDTPAAPSN